MTPAAPDTAGTVKRDPPGWAEYIVGSAPLIISAPHGGLLAPTTIPDRTCSGCLTDADLNTQELARSVAAQFLARTGKRVHLVINLLRRSKLDANREVVEATGGNGVTASTWNFYHQSIDEAALKVAAAHGRGLLLDLHGHGHAIARLELGYVISAANLRLSDQALAASSAIANSSIARLVTSAIDRPGAVPLLRGSSSLGALFSANGIPAVPSPSDPAPAAGDEYFDGGYTTDRHGSSKGGAVDAIQIEAYRAGLRDTQTNVDKYAAAIVTVALDYLRVHYGWGSGAAQLQAEAKMLPWRAAP